MVNGVGVSDSMNDEICIYNDDSCSNKNEIDIEVSGNFHKLLSYNLQHYFILLNLRSDI